MKKISLKVRALMPLVIAFGGLLIAFVYYIYHTQLTKFSDDVERNLLEVEKLFEKQLSSETELLNSLVEMVEANKDLQEAWLAKDRESLLERSAPLLTQLEANYRITHFYFHDLNRNNFLRVYDPDRFGDTINRHTIMEAERTGKSSSGLELGKLGTLTLRVIHPWKINGQVRGYIEMGEEIHHIYQKLHEIVGVELYFSIYKEYLEKHNWEAGMHLLNLPHDWDLLGSSVIINQTLPDIPKTFQHFLKKGEHEYMQMASNLELVMDGLIYRVGVIPLFDVADREVGDIVILYNVSKQLVAFKWTIIIAGFISVVIGLALFIFFSKYLGKLDSELKRYQNHLEDLVEERTEELTQALDEITTLRGFFPICSYCKQIRDDKGFWSQVDAYFQKHTEAEFSHGICPDCYEKHFADVDNLLETSKVPDRKK